MPDSLPPRGSPRQLAFRYTHPRNPERLSTLRIVAMRLTAINNPAKGNMDKYYSKTPLLVIHNVL
jgi:hypothetical protein